MSLKETIFSFDSQGTLLTAIQGPPDLSGQRASLDPQGPADSGQPASLDSAVHTVLEAQSPPGRPASELAPPSLRQVGSASRHPRHHSLLHSAGDHSISPESPEEPEGLQVSYMHVIGLVASVASYLIIHVLALVILRFL